MSAKDIATDLTAYLDAQMARRGVPGVAVGIVSGDEELAIGRGVTNVDHPLGVDATTLFQIGSRTKTFTATALMRQVDAGVLDLDAPLIDYLPDFALGNANYTPRVTTRHLVTHTGGWVGDYFLASPIRERGDTALAQIVSAMTEPPCLLPPGHTFSYNNAGFAVAGRLLEVLTGQRYEDAIQELIFDPLGMDHTYFFADDVVTERTVSGHIVRDGAAAVARPWGTSRSGHPVGGIISDARDQLRYARFHLGDGTTPSGERLLDADTMRHMQTPHTPCIGMADAVGVSWMLEDVGGVRTVSHGGSMNGQMSAFCMIPDRQVGITVCTNADTGAVLCQEVVAWVLDRLLGLANPQPTAMAISSEQLDEFVGSYAIGLIEVEKADDHLVLHRKPLPGSELMETVPPPVRLGFYNADHVFDLDEPGDGLSRGKFLRGDDGTIAYLHFHGRLLMRLAVD